MSNLLTVGLSTLAPDSQAKIVKRSRAFDCLFLTVSVSAASDAGSDRSEQDFSVEALVRSGGSLYVVLGYQEHLTGGVPRRVVLRVEDPATLLVIPQAELDGVVSECIAQLEPGKKPNLAEARECFGEFVELSS